MEEGIESAPSSPTSRPRYTTSVPMRPHTTTTTTSRTTTAASRDYDYHQWPRPRPRPEQLPQEPEYYDLGSYQHQQSQQIDRVGIDYGGYEYSDDLSASTNAEGSSSVSENEIKDDDNKEDQDFEYVYYYYYDYVDPSELNAQHIEILPRPSYSKQEQKNTESKPASPSAISPDSSKIGKETKPLR